MAVPERLKGKYFYHFTHIENLESILTNGFLSTNEKNRLGINHNDVANGNIQGRRANMDVPIEPFGKIHDYVPFYFCSTNPMLLGVTNNKNIDQPFLIFFTISIEKIINENVIFTHASANTSSLPNFYSDANDLDKLNWEAIDSKKWGSIDDEFRHERMAEILIFERVPIEWISSIVVWNETFQEEVEKLLKKHKITGIEVQFEPFKNRFFYFKKFGVGTKRNRETLVTGPYFLKNRFDGIISVIKKAKDKEKKENCRFENIAALNVAIEENFCALKELAGIYKLETVNDLHKQNVCDHTLKVVKKFKENDYYEAASTEDKEILLISAYLHDIGKGPHEKWKDKKQPSYPDHPVDSLKMLPRIFDEEIKILTDYQIRMICLLVAYHDLLGEIIGRGRDKKQLFDVVENEQEFDMLNCLSYSDVLSLDNNWKLGYANQVEQLKRDFMNQLI